MLPFVEPRHRGLQRGAIHRRIGLADQPGQYPAYDLAGQAFDIGNDAIPIGSIDPAADRFVDEPLERCISFSELGCRCGDARRIDLGTDGCTQRPDAGAVMPEVRVAGIVDRIDPNDERRQFGAAPAEQWPDEKNSAEVTALADTRQTRQTRTPRQPHQQSLGLVVGVMRSGERSQAALATPVRQRCIANAPRRGLNARRSRDIDFKDPVWDVQRGTGASNQPRFGCGLGTKAVIDGRRFDPTGKCCRRKVQQRHAIGAARDCEADPTIAGQTDQIGSESFDEARGKLQLASHLWR